MVKMSGNLFEPVSVDQIIRLQEESTQDGLNIEHTLHCMSRGRPTPIFKFEGGRQTKLHRKYEQHLWLCGCEVRKAVFCFPCLLFKYRDTSLSGKGVTDVKNMTTTLKRHNASNRHIEAMDYFYCLGTRPKDIPSEQQHSESGEPPEKRVKMEADIPTSNASDKADVDGSANSNPPSPDADTKEWFSALCAHAEKSKDLNGSAHKDKETEEADENGEGTSSEDADSFKFTTGLTLEELRRLQMKFIKERNWDQFHPPRSVLLALVGEVGELAEIFQWKGEVSEGLPEFSDAEREHVGQEISDVLLYLVDLAYRCRVDLTKAVLSKMSSNAKKYAVDKAYGRANKYTDYE